MMRRSIFLSLAALALTVAPPMRAGTEVAASFSSSSSTSGGTFNTPLSASEQEDLGNIRPVSEVPLTHYFHGEVQVNSEFTANARLYHSADKPDFIVNPTLRGGFTAPIGKGFTLDLNAEFDDVTYAGRQDAGFMGFDGLADLQYRFKPTWPKLYAGVEPYYYWSYDTGERLSAALAPVIGIEQTLSLNRGKTLVLFGYRFGDYFSRPSIDTRQSHTTAVALTQQIHPDLYAQFYYQWQYSLYPQGDRFQSRHLVGTSLIYQFTRNLFGSVYVNFVHNASDATLAKYENVNAGVTLTLQY